MGGTSAHYQDGGAAGQHSEGQPHPMRVPRRDAEWPTPRPVVLAAGAIARSAARNPVHGLVQGAPLHEPDERVDAHVRRRLIRGGLPYGESAGSPSKTNLLATSAIR